MSARTAALLLAAALLGASGAPAAAQDASPTGDAIGDAGTAIVMLRLLPGSVPETSALPELADLVAERSAYEAGYGMSNAQLNSVASLPYERSIAQATPHGSALTNTAPTAADGLIQTAVPDNPKQASGELEPPDSPANALVRAGTQRGSVHARWSDTKGACIGTVVESATEIDSLALGYAIPTLPDLAMDRLRMPGGVKLEKSLAPRGGLGTLGGMLSGELRPVDGDGSLVTLPNGMSTKSYVELIDDPDGERKLIRSTSTAEAARISLFQGDPLGMTASVKRQPKLAVTSTGTAKTSEVEHRVPVVTVRRGGKTLFTLDAEHPSKDIPIGVPKAGFAKHPGMAKLKRRPFVGGVAENTKGRVVRLSRDARRDVVDLFVLRLRVGGLNTRSTELTTPFLGSQLGASARLLDVQLLPTDALAEALDTKGNGAKGKGVPKELPFAMPSTLAQYALGEQVARAAAPEGGATCGGPSASAAGRSSTPAGIQGSSTAPYVVPLLWAGALALLGGAVLLVRAPRPARKPSPRPRSSA